MERDRRALLIDAGVGPLTMGPPENPFGILSGGALLDSLATLGRNPADIEAVAFTHLHVDHFGWAPGIPPPAATGPPSQAPTTSSPNPSGPNATTPKHRAWAA